MDLGSFRRARSATAGLQPAPFDYGMLTAALQAYQAGSVTARLQAKTPDPCPEGDGSAAALVELLIGGPHWREAVSRQGGSFNAACARSKQED